MVDECVYCGMSRKKEAGKYVYSNKPGITNHRAEAYKKCVDNAHHWRKINE